MAQGDWTKEEAEEARKSFEEIYEALSKPKQRAFLGHYNDVAMFMTTAKKQAPNQAHP